MSRIGTSGWVGGLRPGIQNLKTGHAQKQIVVPLAALERIFRSGTSGWVGGSRLQKIRCPDAGHRFEKKMVP